MPLMPPGFMEKLVEDNGGWDAVLARAGTAFYRVSLIDDILHAEPIPHLVHYQKNRVIYVSPDELLTWRPEGPSDCTWIVPGTGESR